MKLNQNFHFHLLAQFNQHTLSCCKTLALFPGVAISHLMLNLNPKCLATASRLTDACSRSLSQSQSQLDKKTLRNVASRFSLRVNSISIRTSFESFLSFLFRVFFVYFTLRPGAAQYQLATTMRMLYFSHLRLESVFKICDNTVNAHVCFFSTNLQMYTEITRENRCPQPFPLQNQNIHPPLVWRLYKKNGSVTANVV